MKYWTRSRVLFLSGTGMFVCAALILCFAMNDIWGLWGNRLLFYLSFILTWFFFRYAFSNNKSEKRSFKSIFGISWDASFEAPGVVRNRVDTKIQELENQLQNLVNKLEGLLRDGKVLENAREIQNCEAEMDTLRKSIDLAVKIGGKRFKEVRRKALTNLPGKVSRA